jgi:uncharacterized repeat protein (TIGR04076 family)
MSKLQITVLRKMANQDLADEYCVPGATVPCPHFVVGKQFVVDSLAQPEGFCGWAWNDLHKFCVTLANGGEFGGYHKIVRCCTDGIRPVIFEVSLVADE